MIFYMVLAKVTMMFMTYDNRPNHTCILIDHGTIHYFIIFYLESDLCSRSFAQ